MADSARMHLIIHGRVQGVFYRASTQDTATRLGVTGWVRNNHDGTVELVAEGPRDQLERLLAWCRDGPPHAHVTHIDVTWKPATHEWERFRTTFAGG